MFSHLGDPIPSEHEFNSPKRKFFAAFGFHASGYAVSARRHIKLHLIAKSDAQALDYWDDVCTGNELPPVRLLFVAHTGSLFNETCFRQNADVSLQSIVPLDALGMTCWVL